MPHATATPKANAEGQRVVVSLPKEIVAKVDAKIREDAGDALDKLGVSPDTLRTGYVHKLLTEALS